MSSKTLKRQISYIKLIFSFYELVKLPISINLYIYIICKDVWESPSSQIKLINLPLFFLRSKLNKSFCGNPNINKLWASVYVCFNFCICLESLHHFQLGRTQTKYTKPASVPRIEKVWEPLDYMNEAEQNALTSFIIVVHQ